MTRSSRSAAGAGVHHRRRVPHTNRVRQRHDREVRDLVRPCVAAVGAQPLVVACACARAAEARGVAAAAQGHRRPGALPQPRADVLPRHAEPPAVEVHCSSVPDAQLLYVAQAPLPPSSCTTSQTAIPSRAPRAGCAPCRVSACALAFRALTCSWRQVRELQRQGNASLVMALTGNKADLTDKRKVEAEVRCCAFCVDGAAARSHAPPQEAQAYADENGLFFMETSAKTASNVNGATGRLGVSALRH